MSRTIPDDEIESRLAPGVGKDPSSRARLLAVLEILRVFSDEQDGLTAGEIARIIGRRSGKAPSENTVLEDLKALAENPPFGIEIKAASKGDKKGFRCVQRLVTPDEAAVLVNLVKTCKYLSPAQRNSLSGKLIEAMPPEKQDDVVETVYVDERQTSSFTDVFQTANTASRAIREGHMVSFRTCSHLMNGTVSKGGVLTEAPVALIYSFGHYYLKTWAPSVGDESERVNLRRLDRMVDVSLGGKVKDKGRISQLSREVVRETSEKFDMYGDGTCRTLFLRVEGSHAKYVYDAFGHDHPIRAHRRGSRRRVRLREGAALPRRFSDGCSGCRRRSRSIALRALPG